MEIEFKGRTILIDECDLHLLEKFSWHWMGPGYLVTKITVAPNKRRAICLHRMIIGDPPGLVTDHINRNVYDNRRFNLRACSYQANNRNQGERNRAPGVTWHKTREKWQVVIRDGGKCKWLGFFEDKAKAEEAARIGVSKRTMLTCPP